nr:LytTR family DNA-binding domain-containing protein [Massilia sp. Root351]
MGRFWKPCRRPSCRRTAGRNSSLRPRIPPIRTPLKELAETLDEAGFWQVHRRHVVAVKRIAAANRHSDGEPALPASLQRNVRRPATAWCGRSCGICVCA